MKTGINQWSFASVPLEQMLTIAAAAGFETFEPAVSETGEDVLTAGLHLGSTAADARTIAVRARSLGLQTPTLASGLGWKYPINSSDPAVRARAREANRRVLDLAAALGAATILLVPGVVSDQIAYDDAWQRSLEEVAHLAEYAAQVRVQIGLENVWNKFLLSPLEMARFVDELHSPWVGVYFDVGNVLVHGFPEQWIRILGRRIVAVHVKDFNPGVGNITGFTNLLAGAVNWTAVREQLLAIDYQGALTAELAPYRQFPEQHARDTANHIRLIIEGNT